MTSRQPPSQRARSSIDHAVRHNARGQLSQGGPGFLGGRFATAQPVPGGTWADAVDDAGDEGPESDIPAWEDDDSYSPDWSDVALGECEVVLSHSQVVEESLTVWWMGAKQPPSSYTVDWATGVVTIPLSPFVTTAHTFEFQYQWTGTARNYAPVVAMYVGTNQVNKSGSVSSITSIALPAGTVAGDLLAVGLIGSTAATCTDSRGVVVSTTNAGWRPACVWEGYADGSGDPISVTVTNDTNAYGQFVIATVAAFRAAPGEPPLRWATGAVGIAPTSYSTTDQMPGLSAPDVGGAICVYLTQAALGGVYAAQDWGKAPAYTSNWQLDNAYVEVDYALTLTDPVPAQTTPNTNSPSTSGWTAAVLGLRKRVVA